MTPIKPTTVRVRAAGIPDDLKAVGHWVSWKWQWRVDPKTGKGRWTKPPLMVTGEPASVTDPRTWATFNAVLAAYRESSLHFDGIGYCVTEEDRLVGLDLDKVRDPLHGGAIKEWALALLLRLNTYTEVTPSGFGVRAWCYGKLPPRGRRKGQVEIYETARYFTCTGHGHEDFPTRIEERTAALAALHADIFGSNGQPAAPDIEAELRGEPPASALIEQAMAARNGGKFRSLWEGHFKGDYPSHSEADLALCGLLAFWTGRDAGLMDALFRQSGLMREKWDERHFSRGETYGQRTIATAVAECTEVYTIRPKAAKKGRGKPAAREDLTSDIEDPPEAGDAGEPEPAPVSLPAYTFQPAFGSEHFVSQYIELVSVRTDAAHEYAEAAGLILLAVATPGVRARLTIFPSGLGTNLYLLVLGASTRSRKSTVMRATTDLIERSSLAGALMPDKMSPEAFVEQIAQRDGAGALWPVDEFGPMLGKFHHATYMEDFAGNLLSGYDGKQIWGARRSKRNKDTGRNEQDQDRARQPHLNIYALSTPALLFKKLILEDIAGGLLPRFGIVFPLTKPQRRDIERVQEDLQERERLIITWLNRIAEWSANGGQVDVDDAALIAINAYDRAGEDRQAARDHDDVASLMFERHLGMLVKVAMLSSIGRSDLDAPILVVTAADVHAAEIVLDRWATFATTFVGKLGDSELEGQINRASALVQKYGHRHRRDLSRSLKLSKRQLDEIEATMRERDLITAKDGVWTWVKQGRGK